MHIKFSFSAHTISNKSNIIYSIKSFNKRYLIRRSKRPWTNFRGLLPPSPDIIETLTLHRLLAGLLFRLLLGLLLPFSVDI
jgi:hypothetical protein